MDSSKIISINQIAIVVSDLEKAKVFYGQVLELPFLFDAPPGMAFYHCGGVRLMLTLPLGDKKDAHTSVIYYKVGEIQTFFEGLKKKGIALEREPALVASLADHDLWMGFVRDPDGNLVGIQEERPRA